MRVKFRSFVVPALLLVGGMGSSAHAQHLENGNFNADVDLCNVSVVEVEEIAEFEIDLGDVKMKMAAVPQGTFWMGGGADNDPVKKVEVSEKFYMGVTEVTQAQWRAVMGADKNPSKFKGDNLPVETVSWTDAKMFIDALNLQQEGQGYKYRLPTEVEWEYSCRGGATSKDECKFDFYFDQPTNDLSTDEANFDGGYPRGNGKKTKSKGTTVDVGTYKPNKLGLYDMHGNVWEWTDTPDGAGRVLRGAHWGDRGQSCKASARLTNAEGDKNENLGFRLAASKPVTEIMITQNEQDTLNKLLKENNANTGDIQISLYWESKNDLDLHVTDPNGEEIFHQHQQSASGGKQDVDMNATIATSQDIGVEHIFWPEGKAPKGKYKIEVNLYRNSDSSEKIDFKVQLMMNRVPKTFKGAVVSRGEKVTVYEFEMK